MTDELKAKYPTSLYAPRNNCRYCGGSGEKLTRIEQSEFSEKRDVVSPCICLFVNHDLADKAQKILNESIDAMKHEATNE